MMYSELQDRLPHEKLIEICVANNKTPQEVIKECMKIDYSAKLWNKVHPECGELIQVEREDSSYSGYMLKLTWKPSKVKRGQDQITTRSDFFHDNGEMEDLWRKYLGQQCLFYVSYTENKEDGSVYRILLDVEPR